MFSVWAPFAKSVDLVFRDSRQPMKRGDDGWWRADQPRTAGLDYAYSINGGRPLPDPRSAWQPSGVHDFSRVVDHREFAWTDQRWQAPPLPAAVIYELHVGTFTREGTFEAAIEKLPHLVSLGVTHLQLMPVAEFEGDRGWGYDGVDLFAPHHAYGGPDGLKRLVDSCHACGLAVLVDVVYNHLGPMGNYLAQFGPYFTDRHQTPWGPAVNLDGADSDEVRRYFCDNALMWLRDYHVDGLRLDAVHAMIDTSAVPFVEQLATEVDELEAHLGKHLVLIAESDKNDPRVVRPWEIGGFGLHAQWSDDFHHALHAVLTGEKVGYYSDFGAIGDLATAFQQPYVYAGRHSPYRRRRQGRPTEGLSGHKFLAYAQNHDQLGNRARGDRMCHLANSARERMGAALVLTSPFIPLLFMGEEWSASSPFQYFVSFLDPALNRAVREGRRREFAAFVPGDEDLPDPGDPATFERSKLPWNEARQPPGRAMIAWVRRLIGIRRRMAALTNGRLDLVETRHSEAGQWLVVERGPVTIVCNFALQAQSIPLEPGRSTTVLLASNPDVTAGELQLNVPPETVVILGVPEEASYTWSESSEPAPTE
ncbi:MAG: malto-oligosyltrehalose trehalohydrolase [Pirellulales bacterium]